MVRSRRRLLIDVVADQPLLFLGGFGERLDKRRSGCAEARQEIDMLHHVKRARYRLGRRRTRGTRLQQVSIRRAVAEGFQRLQELSLAVALVMRLEDSLLLAAVDD